MVICYADPSGEKVLGLQLFCITDNEMLSWPRQSLLVWNWSMRVPFWPLSGVGLCIMALHLEERSGLCVEFWIRTWPDSIGVLLPSHQSCSLPPQVSIWGKTASDVWHAVVCSCVSHETETLSRKCNFLVFFFILRDNSTTYISVGEIFQSIKHKCCLLTSV